MNQNHRKAIARIFLVAVIAAIAMFALGVTAFAEETASVSAAVAAGNDNVGLGLIAAAMSVGIAGIGAGIAVGAGAPAAIGALTEDAKTFGKALIFVVLGEGIALYGMLISILILAKI